MEAITSIEAKRRGFFALRVVQVLCERFSYTLTPDQEEQIRAQAIARKRFYVHIAPVLSEAPRKMKHWQKVKREQDEIARLTIFNEDNCGLCAKLLDSYTRAHGPLFRLWDMHVEFLGDVDYEASKLCETLRAEYDKTLPKYDDTQKLEDTSHYKTFMAAITRKPVNGKRIKRSSAPEFMPSESSYAHVRWSQWENEVWYYRQRDIMAERRRKRELAKQIAPKIAK